MGSFCSLKNGPTQKQRGDRINETDRFSFVVYVLDGRDDMRKKEKAKNRFKRRTEESISLILEKQKAEGPLSWILIDREQHDLLQDLGIKASNANRHHPVPTYCTQRLDWFIGKFEENDTQALKKNKSFKRYNSIQEITMAYLSVSEINNRAKFLKKLKDLAEDFHYLDVYRLPKEFHGYYNTMCRNCKPVNVIKELNSIFLDNNYDKKREEAILKLIYVVAVMENKKIDLVMVEMIEDALAKGAISMEGVLKIFGLRKDIMQEYIEILFLPRNYERMSDFFDLLEKINEVR